MYILFPKELTEALNTIIHSKRGEITDRTVLSYKKSVSVLDLGSTFIFTLVGWFVNEE